MQETMPYVYSSQYQQDPLPAGGGIFKQEWFWETDEDPNILSTFICADTAETDKSYNDATVFSFFGVYKITHDDYETGQIGLHILDCVELRIEPKDLEREFMAFYSTCMRYRIKPRIAAIEKKSTGVTLASTLKNIRGLQVIDIERTHATGNKTTRFLEIQPILAARQVSIPKDGKHTHLVKEHMRKITANDSHRFDDIADTIYDGVKLGIIDNLIMSFTKESAQESEKTARNIMGNFKRLLQLRTARST
jgi:predicted phage terminase large subunit-like protein